MDVDGVDRSGPGAANRPGGERSGHAGGFFGDLDPDLSGPERAVIVAPKWHSRGASRRLQSVTPQPPPIAPGPPSYPVVWPEESPGGRRPCCEVKARPAGRRSLRRDPVNPTRQP